LHLPGAKVKKKLDERVYKGVGANMLMCNFRRCGFLASVGAVVFLLTIGLLQLQGTARAAQKSSKGAAADQADFYSSTAGMERDPGTPVGPPKQVILCHNGHTIRVSEKAAAAHFAHGDQNGPCPGNYVICHRYPNFDADHTHNPYRTIIVNQQDLPKYLAAGDTQGPCPNQVFMCTRGNKTIVVAERNVQDHLSRGQQIGLCPGKVLICYKNHTIVINDSEWPSYQAKGACQGYCYGSPGPLVSETNSPCSTASPTVAAPR
jgi:hypothetical protein